MQLLLVMSRAQFQNLSVVLTHVNTFISCPFNYILCPIFLFQSSKDILFLTLLCENGIYFKSTFSICGFRNDANFYLSEKANLFFHPSFLQFAFFRRSAHRNTLSFFIFSYFSVYTADKGEKVNAFLIDMRPFF